MNIDLAAFQAWLQNKLGSGAEISVEPVAGGQSNPTWFVECGGCRLVLRKKPAGDILPGAHAVEREFRVLSALSDSVVPVPRVLWLEEDETVLGTPFYVMERLDGRVFSKCDLPGVPEADRREMYLDMARTLAALHSVRPEEVGLGDFGRPGDYFARQIRRWSRQYEEAEAEIPALDVLKDWLPANTPRDDGASAIAHGDFRLGNLLFHPTEPKVIAVLDWELSTLGHPLADLGFCVIPWHSSPDEYGGLLGTRWRESGIPTRDEFVAEYFAHAPTQPPLLPFHVAFALFRFSVIFVGIAERARKGNAAAANASQVGPLAERFAERALEVVRGERMPFKSR
ncbi:phosphotransferase family protein [Amorphus orientalis]|uniref:Aminoglycoside phosphotransferase (APT) family kinase protein n=1 Tax=Amorphus orientalis TaxID=649198 RepID=A0AAE4ARW4_9HYPH|nr:phosphotransferase family protein [Amorphus orientalis]MDQ0314533.1 aminoglycoside phosphotransferase (APT) family kinase protein [Amorphus orientalis]